MIPVSAKPSFAAIYRWRLRAGTEEQFRTGWERRTRELVERGGALGSCLHRCDDGTWVAYARWPDQQTWAAAHELEPIDREARALVLSAVEEQLPSLFVEIVADLLVGLATPGAGLGTGSSITI